MTSARASARALAAALAEAPVPELPPRRPGSRGIVTAAGTPRQLLCAWLAVRRLRELGCALPVEVFHAAGEAVPPDVVRAFPGDTRFRQLDDPGLAGFQIKPFALWHASFDRCLWLDADNLALRDPSFLLEGTTPAICWPDAFRTSDPVFLAAFDPALPSGLEFESGQLVVFADACREALWRACLLNGPLRHRAYAHVFGDKDTWRLAFAGTSPRPSVVSTLPTIVGEVSVQVPLGVATLKVRSRLGRRRDLGLLQACPPGIPGGDGAPLFFHRTVREWHFFDRQPTVAWVQDIPAQLEEPRQRYVPAAPAAPPADLLALERWALDTAPEVHWFLASCGVSSFRRRLLARSFQIERALGVG